MHLPQGMAFGNWDFATPTVRDLTFEVDIRGNVSRHPGRYLQLYDGHIGAVGCYFGFQTDVFKPGFGGQGHGLLFSRWATRDPSDARVAPDGWIESAEHEGAFVGVRALVPWTLGRYRCDLEIVDRDGNLIWYEFSVTAYSTNERYSAGFLRFPTDQINSGGGSWTEVYSGIACEADVPETELRVLSVSANQGTSRPTRCSVCYDPQFSRSDAYIDNGTLIIRSGRGVDRIHDARHYELER